MRAGHPYTSLCPCPEAAHAPGMSATDQAGPRPHHCVAVPPPPCRAARHPQPRHPAIALPDAVSKGRERENPTIPPRRKSVVAEVDMRACRS